MASLEQIFNAIYPQEKMILVYLKMFIQAL